MEYEAPRNPPFGLNQQYLMCYMAITVRKKKTTNEFLKVIGGSICISKACSSGTFNWISPIVSLSCSQQTRFFENSEKEMFAEAGGNFKRAPRAAANNSEIVDEMQSSNNSAIYEA